MAWLCRKSASGDDNFGALVMPQPYAYDVATPRSKLIGELAQRHGKIACNVWLSEWLEGPGARECELNPNVALFRSMDRCFATLAAGKLNTRVQSLICTLADRGAIA